MSHVMLDGYISVGLGGWLSRRVESGWVGILCAISRSDFVGWVGSGRVGCGRVVRRWVAELGGYIGLLCTILRSDFVG